MSSSNPLLRVQPSTGPSHSVRVDKNLFTIGRRPDCDLVIPDKDVSRLQAEIRRTPEGYLLKDRGSTFGTVINGVALRERLLKNRDVICLGEQGQIEIVFLHDDRMSRIIEDIDSGTTAERSDEDRNYTLLLEICNGFNSMTSLQDLLELAMDAILDVTRADRGFLLLRDEEGKLMPRVGRKVERQSLNSEDLNLSRSIVDEVAATGEPVFMTDTRNDRRVRNRPSVSELDLQSIVCLPLTILAPSRTTSGGINEEKVIGIIYADSKKASAPLSRLTRELLRSIAVQATIALENFRLRQEDLERRLTERELERLRELDRIKSEFLSNVSHELRTPLTAIRGSADNMLDGLTGELNDQQRRYIVRIRDNSAQLTRLIEDLLDLSRIESGRIPLEPQSLSVPRLLQDAIESIRPLAEDKGIRLETETPRDDVVLTADRDRLMQVLFNLLGNAIKFVPTGGRVVLCVKVEDKDALISVEDDGPGLRPEDLEKIFDRFYQIPGTEGAKSGGSGLGLPISRSLVELHGGRLWAENAPGGCRFSFTVPLTKEGDS